MMVIFLKKDYDDNKDDRQARHDLLEKYRPRILMTEAELAEDAVRIMMTLMSIMIIMEIMMMTLVMVMIIMSPVINDDPYVIMMMIIMSHH